MKVKNLKSYDIYEKTHIKENMMSLAKNSNIAEFDKSDENLEDIKEEEECESCEDNNKVLGTETEKKVELPVIAHVEIATEIEIPTSNTEVLPQTLPISEPTNIDGFNPNQNTNGFPQQETGESIADTSKIFSVVRIMTQNGEKIGMCYTDEVGEYGIPVHSNIDFNVACDLVKSECLSSGTSEFSSENDKIIGHIPSFMITKKSKSLGDVRSNTSYIPK